MGLYTDGMDLIYQHWYDNTIADLCSTKCWDGSDGTPNDKMFWSKYKHEVCRPNSFCNSSMTIGIPRSENQMDFFMKSELKLYLFHALGAIRWM